MMPERAELWTDRPEIAFAVEMFNASQTRFHLEVAYVEDIPSRLISNQGSPTLVVGEGLLSSQLDGRFIPLDDAFGEYLLRRESFYETLLAAGMRDGEQRLLPVSFNLPLIAFVADESVIPSDPSSIGLPELRDKAAGFADNPKLRGGKDPSKKGFSLRFQDELMYQIAVANGAGFREGSPLDWERSPLDRVAEDAVAIAESDNGGIEAEDAFQFRFLAGPPSKWILDGRVRFAYLTSSELFRLPEDRRSTLDFRWLAGDAGIPILDDIVFAGIAVNGQGKEIAREFLVWLFRPETQFALLERLREYKALDRSFGFIGGFSAVREVNEVAMVRLYPGLSGKTPPAPLLIAPRALPVAWFRIKQEALLPSIRAAAAKAESEPATETLRRAIGDWLKVSSE